MGEIQISSKTNECFERFVIKDTADYSLPMNALWTDVSTMNEYFFEIECMDKIIIESEETNGQLFSGNAVRFFDTAWFWIFLLMILLICCSLFVGVWLWNKYKKAVIVYEPKNVLSISNISRQDLELQHIPSKAYIDNQIAAQNNDDLKIAEDEPDGVERMTSIGSTASDPNMNPNLKKFVSVTAMNSEGGAYKEEVKEDVYATPVNHGMVETALDILAGTENTKRYGD